MLPLQGITVIAVEQYGAGPFGTMLLADLGADVIKIETPGKAGEIGRQVGPYFFGEGDSHFFQAFNRNKRSITLDLKSPQGQAIFRDLAGSADAVLDNLRGDLPEKLQLTYADLRDVNPQIVCAHLSAYGREGPRKSWPGYDYLMQAEAGYLSLTGEPDGPPSRFGLSIVDMMTGLMTSFALVSAVLGARENGQGRDVDVSLFDTALHNLTYLAAWYLNAGYCQGREPRSSHPSLTPSQLYTTSDGWIFIMCNKEKFWPILAEKLGHPEWADDPRFATFQARLDNRALVTEMLDDALQARTTDDWIADLGGEIPVAPVYDVGQALDSSFVTKWSRTNTFVRREGGEPVHMLTSPIRLADVAMPRRAGPGLGADTDEVLTRLGYSAKDLARLRDQNII